MKSYPFIFLLALSMLLSCKRETKNAAPKKQRLRPNVVLILADDQGWGDLSHNGNTNLQTPHINALAKYGVSFENFYVQPVCSPTRAELLTGRHFTRLGVYRTSAGGERMNLGETTIAEVFKKAGYVTGAYGKWHNGMQPPYHPNARGFDDFYGFASGHWGNYFNPILEHNGKFVKGNGYIVDDLTDHGLDFIEAHQDESFFLYLPYNTPHSPMQVPDAYWDPLKDKPLKKHYSGEGTEDENFTKAALAMVENIDYNVGRITAKLRKLYLEDDTIIIFLSDNGPNSFRWNGGLRGKKGSVDEGGVRTPFFIQWKDSLPEGKKIDAIASAVDLLPTLTSLTGIAMQTKQPVDGNDLTPLLFDQKAGWKDKLVYNHWDGKTSVRSQRFRLDDLDRLYDMQNDPGQTRDIALKFPKFRDSLRDAKTHWLLETLSLPKDDIRPFTIGHPEYPFTVLSAGDGIPHGSIKRSNRYPNDSFFTHWQRENDSITWKVEVLSPGAFEVDLYYTCAQKDIGAVIELSLGSNKIATKITDVNDPPLKGMENDRVPRIESYVKDFKPIKLGTMILKKGSGTLTLKALKITGDGAIDMNMLRFKRLE